MGPRHEAMERSASQPTSEAPSAPSSASARSSENKKKEQPPSWRQSRRPLATAVGMFAVVLMLMVVGGIMIKFTLTEAYNRTSRLKLEDIINNNFVPKKFNGSWVSDSTIMFQDESNNVILFDLYEFEMKTLTSNYHVIPTTSEPVEYQLSHNKNFLLAMHNRTQFPGQSPLAQYEIIDIANQTNMSLTYLSGRNKNDPLDKHLLQLAMWSNRRSDLLFVYHNDLYYRPNTALKIQPRLSSSGVPGIIFNGVTDFLYREVILKTESAVWPSPNGQRVAYATFNDTLVQASYVQYYGKPGSLDYQYPQNLEIRYPKAGTPLPSVTLSVLDLDYLMQKRLSMIYAPIPQGLTDGDVLLTAVAWMNNDEIASVWMNRLQTNATITVFNYQTGISYDLLKVSEDYGWLELIPAPFFSPKENRMALILPQDQGGIDGKFPHVCLVQHNREKVIVKALTRGKFSVKKIVSWDKLYNYIYFLGTEIDSPSIQHLYRVSDDQWTAPNNPECITCNWRTSELGMPCLYNTASFNANSTFYMLNCEGPDVPEITIFDRNHRWVMLWEKNNHIRKALQNVGHLPSKQYIQIDLGHGFKAHVEVSIPPDYNPKRNKKYPLLIHVDGSPDTCPITEHFSVGWDDYVTGSKNVVLARISARGSGLRGSNLSHAIYKKFGTVEIDDIIHVTRNLQNLFTFIDRARTAIWGRHYGGYTATMTLVKDVDHVFQCGFAVSPITEWLYYDAVRAERYMHLPSINYNLGGYIDAGLTNKVENLRHKKFMLLHGTSDSMVHSQHSMMLAKVLEENGIMFSQHIYPDEDLSIPGVNSHFFRITDKFLDSCFREYD